MFPMSDFTPPIPPVAAVSGGKAADDGERGYSMEISQRTIHHHHSFPRALSRSLSRVIKKHTEKSPSIRFPYAPIASTEGGVGGRGVGGSEYGKQCIHIAGEARTYTR